MTHPGIRPAPHFLGGHLSLLQSLAKVLLCAQEPSLDNSRSFSILKSGSCVVALHILGSICALLQGLSKVLVCAQEPSLDDSKNFSILQPGSSVATALSEGESKRKSCGAAGDHGRAVAHRQGGPAHRPPLPLRVGEADCLPHPQLL